MRWTILVFLIAASCAPAPVPVATSPATTTPATVAPTAAVPTPAPTPTNAPITAATTWKRIADIPTARSGVAAATFANTIYVVGGIGAPTAVERYVPISAAWRAEPSLPIGVDHAMAAAIQAGGHWGLYAFGGNTGSDVSARSFHLRPGATEWREIAPMPAPRSAGAAVAIGERIYLVGGAWGPRLHLSVYEYDPAKDAWRILADIPTARHHLAAAELGGRVCAVGGRVVDLTRSVAALECFDSARNAWEKLPNAPTARSGGGAAAVGGKLVFVGGEGPQGALTDVEIFDTATSTWTRGQDLPTARHGIGVAAASGVVYSIAGTPNPGASPTAVCEALGLP